MHPPITLRSLLRTTVVALCCAMLVLAGPAAFAQGKGNSGQGPAQAQGKSEDAPGQAKQDEAPGQAKKDEAPAQAKNDEAPAQAKNDEAPAHGGGAAAPGQAASAPVAAPTPQATPSPSPTASPRGNAARPTWAASPSSAPREAKGSDSTPVTTSDGGPDGLVPSVKALLAGSEGGSAQVGASFTCLSATVWSTKDLSNVVLVFADGSTQKSDGLSGFSGTFAGMGAHEGKEVVAVYVKSGSNTSGDGPGYGERIDSDAVCTAGTDDALVEAAATALPAPGTPAVSDSVSQAAQPSVATQVDASSAVVGREPAPAPGLDATASAAQPAVAVLGEQVTAPVDSVVVTAGAVTGQVALAATGAGIVVQLVAGLLLIAGGAGLRRRAARR